MRLADIASGQPLPVAGKSFAGQPYHGEWPAGTCIRIMTGAPVPEGCEAVGKQRSRLNKRTMACVLLLKCVAGKIFAVAVKISLQVRLFSGGDSPDYRRAASNCFTGDCRSSGDS